MRPAALLIAALLLPTTACGGGDDSTPRDKPTSPSANGTAGSFGNAPEPDPEQTFDDAAGASGAAGAGVAMVPIGNCAQGIANTSPVTPTVWLVLDGSGSMNEDFSGETRWTALRAALMDPGGIVETLASNVRFGMVLYSGAEEDDDGNAPAQCVNLTVVEPALDNFAALDAQLPQEEPGGWTPTDQALVHVVDNLPVTNTAMLDVNIDPVYVILATDGAPNDRCAGDSGGGQRGGGGSELDPEVAQRVLDAVGRGVTAGMELLVISLAGGDDELQQHLEEVTGLANNGFPPFVPDTRDELVTTLQQIVGGASCRILLDGTVAEGQECSGEVTLNSMPLECGGENGFRLVDTNTVQLVGTACSDFLANDSLVLASFPCGVFSPQ